MRTIRRLALFAILMGCSLLSSTADALALCTPASLDWIAATSATPPPPLCPVGSSDPYKGILTV
jgi:hypothetical protein